ncbi:MAG: hypothetical protein VYE22_41075 [Myxococcota bacterium]|nr:hypothetical protein [Myxococcota bacterium]
MRTKKTRAGLLAALATIGVWACDAAQPLGDAMVEAGAELMDAGRGLRDGASSDAAAQPPEPVSVPCVPRTWRIVQADGPVRETTVYYAEIEAASITPTSRIRAVMCDEETLGDPSDPEMCPDGATCTGEHYQAPALRCRVAVGGEVEEGRARFRCGNRQIAQDASGTTIYDFGARWRDVRVFVE